MKNDDLTQKVDMEIYQAGASLLTSFDRNFYKFQDQYLSNGYLQTSLQSMCEMGVKDVDKITQNKSFGTLCHFLNALTRMAMSS